MNNRGQVYLIAALILSVALFLLISQTNVVQRILMEDDFEQLSENFDIESAKFMNSLLAESSGLAISEVLLEFTKFTESFTDYANVENPEFEFVYVLEYKGEPITGYYVKKTDISFIPDLETTSTGDTEICTDDVCLDLDLTGESNVISGGVSSVIIGNIQYNLNLEPGAPQMVIISREEKGNQTKVFLNHEFITGIKV